MGQRVSLDLEGRSAIVTGGTRGLGRDIALCLAEAGCRVAVCGRNRAEGLPKGIMVRIADVRDPEQCFDFTRAVVSEHGGLDILINNAGGSPSVVAEAINPRLAEAILRLNLLGPLFMAQAAFAPMCAGGGGSVVNIASVSGIRPSPGTAIYGAAKAGLLNLTQSLAQEWGVHGIRVNAIVAGLMATETAADTYGDADAQGAVARSLPLQRMGAGSDLANAVLWLCSPLASWVSGARINVDGGGERPSFLDLVKGA